MADRDYAVLGRKYVLTIPRLHHRLGEFKKAWGEYFAEPIIGVDFTTANVTSLASDLGLKPYGMGKYLPLLAIYLSHRRVWEKIAEDAEEVCTIFEDDARPTGEPWVRSGVGLVRWQWHEPQWVGSACYTLSHTDAASLLRDRAARSPDWHMHLLGFRSTSTSKPVIVNAQPSYPVETSRYPHLWVDGVVAVK